MKKIWILSCLAVCLFPQFAEAQTDREPIRVGVHGLTHDHVHGLLRQIDKGEIRLVGIAEPNQELAKRYAKKYGIEESLLYTENKYELESRNSTSADIKGVKLADRPYPYQDPIAYLAAVLRGNVKPEKNNLSSLENNRIVVEILAAAIESARTGETVVLSK